MPPDVGGRCYVEELKDVVSESDRVPVDLVFHAFPAFELYGVRPEAIFGVGCQCSGSELFPVG